MVLRILGHDFKVVYDGDVRTDHGYMGSYNCLKEQIVIDSGMSEANKKTTLVHEVFEALNDQMELGLEHKVIQQLEAGWFAVMMDNPKVFGMKMPDADSGKSK